MQPLMGVSLNDALWRLAGELRSYPVAERHSQYVRLHGLLSQHAIQEGRSPGDAADWAAEIIAAVRPLVAALYAGDYAS